MRRVLKSTIVPMLQRGHAFLDALRPLLSAWRGIDCDAELHARHSHAEREER